MLAISLETARNAALVVALIAVGLAVLSAWIVKAIVAKVVTAAVLVGLGLVVWTQRASLDDCADTVQERLSAGADVVDTTCTFFGRDVPIPTRGTD